MPEQPASAGTLAMTAHHSRWTLPVIPTTMPDMPHNWFVTPQRAN
jgi:hypothetical protein